MSGRVRTRKKDKKSVDISVAGKQEAKQRTLGLEVLSIILFMMAIFLYLGLKKFQGLPQDTQFLGIIGTYIMKGLGSILGEGTFLLVFFLLFWSIHIGFEKRLWSVRMNGTAVFLLAVLLGMSLYGIPKGLDAWNAGRQGMGGGYMGGTLGYVLGRMIGEIGSLIVLILSLVVSLVYMINRPPAEIARWLFMRSRQLKQYLDKHMYYESQEPVEAAASALDKPLIINGAGPPLSPVESLPENKEQRAITDPVYEFARPAAVAEPVVKPVLRAVTRDGVIPYQKPPLDLLSNIRSERSIDKKNIRESIAVLEDTFASFGIIVKVNQVSCGPAVTRYELTPAPGVKVSKILSLTDDLQLNLAAPGIRLEAPIPGKSAVGIEVPNSKILSVGLRQLLSAPAFKKINSPLAFALGEDITGNPVVAHLTELPHALIAGSTGSGKSVCLNCIIMSFLYNATPEELKLVFIDPKMVELTVYNGIPHLLTPVVTNPKRAAQILRWMVNEMEKRYRLFAEKSVRDIQRYNQVVKEKLPYIVIIIDELADLMMVSPVEVEDAICRLAQMARAAGMHLIVATQRPSVDVVTGIIKANIPSRVAFSVSSQADSRTILDMGGAEKLLGKGDMLFFPVGAVKPYRVQGAYVSDLEIENTVQFIREQSEGLPEEDAFAEVGLQMDEMEDSDDLFWDAVGVFVETRKASVSLLQRKLRVGYARAARLVDLMEDRGMVSPLDNNKKREVLIDSDQLEKLLEHNRMV
ncbi:MAG TPA: DNA translocase FtsK 4TM domain-containing protein [Syntrophomonadaceae bacterium]|nr:DNA translocase FtsK 4TM domain-containing protein [Syntrophomonadaceae bacterium]